MCTIERLGGRLDCLFGEVALIRVGNLHGVSMSDARLKKMAQERSSRDVACFVYSSALMKKCNVTRVFSESRAGVVFMRGDRAMKSMCFANLSIRYLTIRRDDHPISRI